MLCLPALLLWPGSSAASRPESRSATRLSGAERAQAIADAFRAQLPITENVVVRVVPVDRLLVSVRWMEDRPGTFLLSIDESFLAALDEDELRAVIAHEFGHIWIFTNHPYLQTEQLANRIAMRLVSRESLANVYPKVWERAGTKGDLTLFLGQ